MSQINGIMFKMRVQSMLGCIFFFCLLQNGFTQSIHTIETIPNNVLFVGNSYTYFGNLPQHLALMAESEGIDIKTRQSTNGGVNLREHWLGLRDLDTKNIIENGDFDAVVLQDHSMGTIHNPDTFIKYGSLLADLIRSQDAEIYLYATWSREWDPFMQKTIAAKYEELAHKIGARVVPVGAAWKKAKELRSDIDIYFPDGSHPSLLGTYLTACTFFEIFTDQSSVGLPHRLISEDVHGEKLYVSIVPPNDALFCQKIAHEICKKK